MPLTPEETVAHRALAAKCRAAADSARKAATEAAAVGDYVKAASAEAVANRRDAAAAKLESVLDVYTRLPAFIAEEEARMGLYPTLWGWQTKKAKANCAIEKKES